MFDVALDLLLDWQEEHNKPLDISWDENYIADKSVEWLYFTDGEIGNFFKICDRAINDGATILYIAYTFKCPWQSASTKGGIIVKEESGFYYRYFYRFE